jgi:virginiamycin B lyase
VALNEKLEIVEVNAANAVVSLLNLNDGVHYMMEAGTFQPIPPEPTPVLAQDQRRWGGSREVGEVHANGGIEWTAAVTASTEQEAIERVEALLAQLAANPYRSFVLWQVPGASHPTLFEMRGTGTWTPKYNVASFEGAQLFLFTVHVPVAPLAQGLPVQVYEKAGLTLPAVIALSAIPGDAPAKAEVSIETGEEPNQALVTGASGPQMIAVQGEYIYWCNMVGNTIGRAKVGGTEVNQSFITGCSEPVGIAVNATNIFWTNASTGDIGKATLAGGSVSQTFITGGNKPAGIAVTSEHIYWVNRGSGYIARATLAGASIEQAWVNVGVAGYPKGLAVTSSDIYWTNLLGGTIGRMTITGSSVDSAFITNAGTPEGIAVTAQYIYWANNLGGYIQRAPLSGGEGGQFWGVATVPIGVAVSSEYVYWTLGPSGAIGRTKVEHSPPIWGLLGWTAKPSTGLATAPFGILDSSEATAIEWTTQTITGTRGGTALVAASNGGAVWTVDPATMVPDSFSGEIAVEVWARVIIDGTEEAGTSPIFTLSAQPQDGLGYGAARYTDEWGSAGRLVQGATEGRYVFRMTRLGTLHLLVNPLAPRIWKLVLEGNLNEGGGELGVDYLLLEPVLQRACSPSSKLANSSYPPFIANVGPTVKTVRSDLSAVVAKPGKYGHPDHGLGGQLLELPPGETEMLVKLSSLVPDAPQESPESEQLSHEAKVTVTVTPRWFLARTA